METEIRIDRYQDRRAGTDGTHRRAHTDRYGQTEGHGRTDSQGGGQARTKGQTRTDADRHAPGRRMQGRGQTHTYRRDKNKKSGLVDVDLSNSTTCPWTTIANPDVK
uniref:Uncharacterized protein n=1 Tax=Haemonchus contortus TaxID=6289 RepID=A0A7I4Y2K8_HAECO